MKDARFTSYTLIKLVTIKDIWLTNTQFYFYISFFIVCHFISMESLSTPVIHYWIITLAKINIHTISSFFICRWIDGNLTIYTLLFISVKHNYVKFLKLNLSQSILIFNYIRCHKFEKKIILKLLNERNWDKYLKQLKFFLIKY